VPRRRTRYWQVEATLRNGAKVTFGVSAAHLPGALLKAYRQLAEFPQTAGHLTVTRLYWHRVRPRPQPGSRP
jgi:hypothetical protein